MSNIGLEGTARCAGLLPGLWPSAEAVFCPSGKKRAIFAGLLILGYLWCSVVTSEISSSNIRNFDKNPIYQQKKIPKKFTTNQ